MKKASVLLLVVMVIALLAGCTTTLPVGVSGEALGEKTGSSEAAFIFGFPMGDASVVTAAANGGITEITSADVNVWFPIVPLYVRVTTNVTGN